MRDIHSTTLIQTLHPKVRADFQAFIEECEQQFNVTIRIMQALRTFAEQQAIYDQGRTKPGEIVTKSPPGASFHQYGLAVDLCVLMPDGKLDWNYDNGKFANIAAQWSITWGGNWTGGFKDLPHFEEKMGHNWRDLLDLYNKKDFIPGTTYVNI